MFVFSCDSLLRFSVICDVHTGSGSHSIHTLYQLGPLWDWAKDNAGCMLSLSVSLSIFHLRSVVKSCRLDKAGGKLRKIKLCHFDLNVTATITAGRQDMWVQFYVNSTRGFLFMCDAIQLPQTSRPSCSFFFLLLLYLVSVQHKKIRTIESHFLILSKSN